MSAILAGIYQNEVFCKAILTSSGKPSSPGNRSSIIPGCSDIHWARILALTPWKKYDSNLKSYPIPALQRNNPCATPLTISRIPK
jgi:hypothetical protein